MNLKSGLYGFIGLYGGLLGGIYLGNIPRDMCDVCIRSILDRLDISDNQDAFYRKCVKWHTFHTIGFSFKEDGVPTNVTYIQKNAITHDTRLCLR